MISLWVQELKVKVQNWNTFWGLPNFIYMFCSMSDIPVFFFVFLGGGGVGEGRINSRCWVET